MRACLAFNAAEAAAKAASVAVADDALVVALLVAALRVFAFVFLRCRFRCFLLGGSAFAFFLGDSVSCSLLGGSNAKPKQNWSLWM